MSSTTGGAVLVSALYNPASKDLFTNFPLKYGISPLTQRRDLYIKPVNALTELFGNTLEFYLPKSCHFISRMQLQVKISPRERRTAGNAHYNFRGGGLTSYIRKITISYGNSFEWILTDDYLVTKSILDTTDFKKQQRIIGFVGESILEDSKAETEAFNPRDFILDIPFCENQLLHVCLLSDMVHIDAGMSMMKVFIIDIPFCENQLLPVCLLSDNVHIDVEFKEERACAETTAKDGITRFAATLRVTTINTDPDYISDLLSKSDNVGVNIPMTQIETFKHRLSPASTFSIPLNSLTGLVSSLFFVIRTNNNVGLDNFVHPQSAVTLTKITLEHNNLLVGANKEIPAATNALVDVPEMFPNYVPVNYSPVNAPAYVVQVTDPEGGHEIADHYVRLPKNALTDRLNINYCVYGMTFSLDAYKSMKENAQLGFLDFTRSNGSSLNLTFNADVTADYIVYVYAIKHNILSFKGSMMYYLS